MWEIDGEIDLSKKLFGGYIKATVIPSSEEKFDEMIKKVSEYIDENKKRPNLHDKNKEINQMGNWLVSNTLKYKRNKENMSNENIRKKWEKFYNKYKEYLINGKEKWFDTLKQVNGYILKYNKRPTSENADKNVKYLGIWILLQKSNYLKYKYLMKDNEIRKIWEQFMKENEKYYLSHIDEWVIKLKNLEEYIQKYKKRPSTHDLDKNIRIIGLWLCNQEQKYLKLIGVFKNENIKNTWEKFVFENKEYFISDKEKWNDNFLNLKEYIKKYDKLPSCDSKNEDIKKLGVWIDNQKKNYKKKIRNMTEKDIYDIWHEFINNNDFKKYFISNKELWVNNLLEIKKYINEYKKRPNKDNINIYIAYLGKWLSMQLTLYNKKDRIMKDLEICNLWEEFITEYQQYFPNNPAIKEKQPDKKSTTLKQKEDKPKEETEKYKKARIQSEYQELTKKMSIQKSDKTNEMFKEDPKLWHQYHDNRDFSFKGYDNQDEIPVNKIISYLEERSNKKLKILDLGCGRNIIKKHFEENKKFEIIGYDHVSYNGSIACDISNLSDEDETVDICIFSQSLMGSNWKKYIDESVRVLRYNGEMIVSESVERYEKIKEYINKLGLHIKQDNYNETNRWFYLHVLNYKVNEKGCDK